ncbi:C40 family peptidase [Clostridium gasigenes]|nr:C40 family peptidase [Clostridium gasigenes]
MIIVLVFTSIGLGNVKASAATNATGQDIINYAKKFIGTPYVYGGTSPSTGFDCSGFTSYVYRNVAGIDIGRTTWNQVNSGWAVSYSDLQPGDLVLTYDCEHVGIYVGNGMYINSPQPGDSVKISPIRGFYSARRILKPSQVTPPQPPSKESQISDLIFDAEFYYKNNHDLQIAFGFDKGALKQHWIDFGIKEGRASSPIFDAKYYLANNSDVATVYGATNYEAAYKHFITMGYKEGRKTSPIFDVNYYRDNYSDLKAYDNEFLYNHFMVYGMNEGRTGSPDFNWENYKNLYSDLKNTFGNDKRLYYYHYLTNGITEGRNAK